MGYGGINSAVFGVYRAAFAMSLYLREVFGVFQGERRAVAEAASGVQGRVGLFRSYVAQERAQEEEAQQVRGLCVI